MKAEIISFKEALEEFSNKDFKNSKTIYWIYNAEDDEWIGDLNDITLSDIIFNQDNFIIVKLQKGKK